MDAVLRDPNAPKGFDYGVAPLPHPANRPDLANYGMVGGNPGTIMKGTKHPNEAWQFLSYMETLGPTMSFANAIENVPQLTAALTSPQPQPRTTLPCVREIRAGSAYRGIPGLAGLLRLCQRTHQR